MNLTGYLEERLALNAICPYFTMFPLAFPLDILKRAAKPDDRILDPFCGRGTTNFAARLLGLDSVGIDASPVATAITASKLVNVDPNAIIAEAKSILALRMKVSCPEGPFWRRAYHPEVLLALSKMRSAFLDDCSTRERIALRGIVMGCLHGPQQIRFQSYFSNQCPRTYAPKPQYALTYWKEHGFKPKKVEILDIIARKTFHYFAKPIKTKGTVRLGDSRKLSAFKTPGHTRKFNWVITSPPYYGMRTYLPDQWLRNWFVGGSEHVDYSNDNQLVHRSPQDFAEDLRAVWRNAAMTANESAKMVVRFGGIADREADPRSIIRASLCDSGWHIDTIKSAGIASDGKRQADTFLRKKSKPIDEYVVWASRS